MAGISSLSVAMVAGEASGDVLAARLLQGLTSRAAPLILNGIGGPRMQQFGFESWWPMETLSVNGLFEVLAHYREIKGIQIALRKRLLRQRPDVFIGVDAPDFNFGLEQSLRSAGIPTVHFIGPSIWAWRGGRIKKIAKSASHMLVVFPFEESIYRQAGIPVTYVGHPLAQVIPLEPDTRAARIALGLDPDSPVLTIMPGSRRSELRHHTEIFMRAALLIRERHPATQFVVPMAGPAQRRLFDQLLLEHGLHEVPLTIVEGDSHAAMAAAEGVLVASGTASLEVALFKKPMVIAYRMLAATYAVLRHMNYQPWIGLPNILARESLVPELIQHAATPQAMAAALLSQWDDHRKLAQLKERFTAMHHSLLRDTSSLAAEAVVTVARQGRRSSS